MRPDRIVVGTDDERAVKLLHDLYAPFNRNHDRVIVMDIKSCRTHQIRRQLHAGHAHIVHERTRQPCRQAGR